MSCAPLSDWWDTSEFRERLTHLSGLVCDLEQGGRQPRQHSIQDWDCSLLLAFGGMAAALVLIAGPWCLAVILFDRLQRFGLLYFCLIGAVFTLAMGSATSSLSPKPLFIEDQTFLEGCMIAVQRQGAGLVLTGLVFGLTFWLVSERQRQSIAGTDRQAVVTADSGSINRSWKVWFFGHFSGSA